MPHLPSHRLAVAASLPERGGNFSSLFNQWGEENEKKEKRERERATERVRDSQHLQNAAFKANVVDLKCGRRLLLGVFFRHFKANECVHCRSRAPLTASQRAPGNQSLHSSREAV